MSRLLDYLVRIYTHTRSPRKRRAIEIAASAPTMRAARAILAEVGIAIPSGRAGRKPKKAVRRPRRALPKPKRPLRKPKKAVRRPRRALSKPKRPLRKPKKAVRRPRRALPKPKRPLTKPKIRKKEVVLFPVRDAYKADLFEMKEKIKGDLAGVGYTEAEKPVVFPAKTMTTNGWMTNNLKNIRKKCVELLLFYTYYTVYWYRSSRTGKPTARVDYMVGRFRIRTLPILPQNISMENLIRGMVSESPYRYDEKLTREASEFVIGLHGPIGYYVTRWK